MMRDLTRLLGQQEFASMDDVNAFLQREVMGRPLPKPKARTDRERAEDLVLAARDERSLPALRRRVAEALKLDPDCIIAHLLLVEVADGPAEALAHARDAVAAGERALAEALADGDMHLWYQPVGRSWLQARALLAEILWQRGDRQQALAEARAILERNPGDNQGMRYILLEWLMQAGSVAEIDALLAAFDDASAAWQFVEALHRFRTQGPGPVAEKALFAAVAGNRHVVPMLSGKLRMPTDLPDSYALGSEDEAALYVHTAFAGWLKAGDAIGWASDVARTVAPKRPTKAKRKDGRG
jgi:tetratricopeptide (TPR) repeat protein